MTTNGGSSPVALHRLHLLAALVMLPCGTGVSAAGGEPAASGSPLAVVRAALESEDFATLSEALESAGSEEPAGLVDALREGLASDSASRQAMAAYGLGTLGRKAAAAAPDLEALLDSKEPLVRLHAAGALLHVADDSRKALVTLGELLEADQVGLRRLGASAVVAAGEGQPERIVPLLVQALKDSDGRTRATAAKGLAAFRANSGPLAVAQWRAAAHEDPEVRKAVLPALRPSELRAPELVPDLLAIARQGDEELRIAALRALGGQGDMSRESIHELAGLLHAANTNSDIRREAAYALRKLGARAEVALPELTRALRDAKLSGPAAEAMR